MDNFFSMDKDCLEFVVKYTMRNVGVHKDTLFFLTSFSISQSKGENYISDKSYGYVPIRIEHRTFTHVMNVRVITNSQIII